MRKSIILCFLLTVVSLVSYQSHGINNNKIVTSKDSINKSKMPSPRQSIKSDTLVETGKFKIYKTDAHASYYADKFNGRKTTSGKRFDNNKYTAAHKKLPFGTKVKVTNEANGKSVVVEINDRGPFVKSREIDLSKRAFKEIASRRDDGAMRVTIAISSN